MKFSYLLPTLLLIIAPFWSSKRLTAAPTNFVWMGSYDTGGEAHSVQIAGPRASVADGLGGLQVIDVSNPRQPVWVGGYDTLGEAYEVQVVDQTAYLADGPNGLEILDISDPAQIDRLGGYNQAGSMSAAVQVRGNLAYLACGNLKIFDVQNPANPTLLSDVDIIGAAWDLRLLSNYTVFAAVYGLSIYEVSAPTQPVWVTNLNLGYGTGCIEIAGHYAYLVDENNGLKIVDLSDPVHPAVISQQAIPGRACHVAVAGDCACVVHDLQSRPKLSAFNVADPANPALITTYNLPGYWANCLTVVGDYVFVANGLEGLVILQAQPTHRPEVFLHPERTNALITWPANALGYSLVSKPDLNASNWLPVTPAPWFSNNVFGVSVPALGTQFFRLRQVP